MKVYTCAFSGEGQDMLGSMAIVAENKEEALEYAKISMDQMCYSVRSNNKLLGHFDIVELDVRKKGVTVITDGEYC